MNITKALLLTSLIFFIGGCGDNPDPKDIRIRQLEHGLQEASANVDRWKAYTVIAGVISTVIFIIGIGMGSSVRKSSHTQTGGKPYE